MNCFQRFSLSLVFLLRRVQPLRYSGSLTRLEIVDLQHKVHRTATTGSALLKINFLLPLLCFEGLARIFVTV